MLTEMTEANLRRYMENMGQDPEDIEETLCVLADEQRRDRINRDNLTDNKCYMTKED